MNSTDALLTTLSKDVQDNLTKSQTCRVETETLLETTSSVNNDTKQLNEQTRSLIQQSELAVSKVDQALDEVTNVSRKMFRETRELQDRTESINQIAQQSADELKELNEKSLVIHSDSIQTQALSKEINRHSLDLTPSSCRASLRASETQTYTWSTNFRIFDSSCSISMNAPSNSLEQAGLATRTREQTRAAFEVLSRETELLTQNLTEALSKATVVIDEVETQSAASDVLFDRSENLTRDLERLKTELGQQSELATQATELATQTVQDLKVVEANLLNTARKPRR